MSWKYKVLSNGVKMPKVGLGTWTLSNEQQCCLAVRDSLALGYELIDTASAYRNEEFIGRELEAFQPTADALVLKTSNKKGVFITSKANPAEMGYQKTYDACLRSLQRLKQPQLDLYLLHWPGSSEKPSNSEAHRQTRQESWKAMERLYHEGKVRAIGVSNFLVHHLEELIKDGVQVVPHVNQVELHPECPNHELRAFAKQHGIAIQAYSSLGSGDVNLLRHPVVQEVVGNDGKKTAAQALLRWAVQQDILVIPRSTKREHLKLNLAVADPSFELSAENMNKLSRMCSADKLARRRCWDPTRVA